MRVTIALLAFLFVTACATESRMQDTTQPRTKAVQPRASSPAAATLSTAADAAPAVAKAKPGYKLARRDGDVVYCKREVPTGSKRPVETCYTPEQLEEIERQTREMQDNLDRQRNSSGCGNFCSSGS